MEQTNKKKWLNGVKEIANYCGFGKTKVSIMVAKGELKGIRKIGKSWMIRRVDLDAFLRYGTTFRKLTKVEKIDILDGGV